MDTPYIPEKDFSVISNMTHPIPSVYMEEVKRVTGIQGPDSSNRERLTELVRRYEKDILRICYVYLRDTEQAKDAVQESLPPHEPAEG